MATIIPASTDFDLRAVSFSAGESGVDWTSKNCRQTPSLRPVRSATPPVLAELVWSLTRVEFG